VATWSEAHVLARAVQMQAPPSVVVSADLIGLGLRRLSRASESNPGLLGWRSRRQMGAVRRGVKGGEAVLTPGSGASLA